MSLKAFHILFITVSVLLALGFSIWGIYDYRTEGNWVSLALAAGSLLCGVVLVVYGRWFLRKLKKTGYL